MTALPQDHPDVQAFLDAVLARVKAREMHAAIREELGSHLAGRIADALAAGVNEDAAVHEAIRHMGDPDEIGRSLHRVHRPRFDWPLFGLILGLIGIGLAAMAAVQVSGHAASDRQLWAHKAAYAAGGLVVLLALARFDYRKLRRLAWPLYGAVLGALWLSARLGGLVNGRSGYLDLFGHRFDVAAAAPLALIVAACGVLAERRTGLKEAGKLVLFFAVVPALAFGQVPSTALLVVYLCAFLALLPLAGRPARDWLIALAPLSAAVLVLTLAAGMRPFYARLLRQRLFGFLHPQDDPLGAGYMILRAQEAVASAGWWGHGLGAVSDRLPLAEAEMVFPALTASFGWLAGALVAAAAAAFLLRLAGIGRKAGDRFGRLLVCGCTTLFAVPFAWNLLMSVGLLPIAGVPLPFISYGGTQLIVQMAAAGLILGVHRRKDTMPRAAEAAASDR